MSDFWQGFFKAWRMRWMPLILCLACLLASFAPVDALFQLLYAACGLGCWLMLLFWPYDWEGQLR